MNTEDTKLLGGYAEERSEAAFSAIMARYRRLVYSTCLRELKDIALAEDATQVVFLILARKATSLRRDVNLSGWLFITARFTARELRRRQYRRAERIIALSEHTAGEDKNALWNQIDSDLNECLMRLGEKDRLAILLRFFEQWNFAEIAPALGQTEDGARHRVNRALEKLRRILAMKGVVVPAVMLASLLTENVVKPVPANAGSVHVTQSQSVKTMTGEVLKAMFIKKVTAAAVSITIAGTIFGGITIVRAQVESSSPTAVPTPNLELSAVPNRPVSQSGPAAPESTVPDSDLSASQVVANSIKAYAGLTSYSCHVEGDLNIGTGPGSVGTADINFVRPAHLSAIGTTGRMEGVGGFPYQLLIVGPSSTFKMAFISNQTYSSPDEGIAAATGVSCSTASTIPSLLLNSSSGASPFNTGANYDASVTRETIDGDICDRVDEKSPEQQTFWISQKTNLIYRLETTKVLADGGVFHKTVTVTNSVINPEIPVSSFVMR
jgi:RNA polymerase sigma factor (sigma-70 family)